MNYLMQLVEVWQRFARILNAKMRFYATKMYSASFTTTLYPVKWRGRAACHSTTERFARTTNKTDFFRHIIFSVFFFFYFLQCVNEQKAGLTCLHTLAFNRPKRERADMIAYKGGAGETYDK